MFPPFECYVSSHLKYAILSRKYLVSKYRR